MSCGFFFMAALIGMHSAMKGLQNGLRVDFGDAEKGAGSSFWVTVALLPVLQSAGADADERGKLGLSKTELFTDDLGIGPFEGGGARGLLFAPQNRAAFLEAGGKLLEEFIFHGNSVSMMDLRNLSWAAVRLSCSFFG